jgi:hypothetical protein
MLSSMIQWTFGAIERVLVVGFAHWRRQQRRFESRRMKEADMRAMYFQVFPRKMTQGLHGWCAIAKFGV